MVGSFADAIERRALNIGIDQGYAKGIDQGMDNESQRSVKAFHHAEGPGQEGRAGKGCIRPGV